MHRIQTILTAAQQLARLEEQALRLVMPYTPSKGSRTNARKPSQILTLESQGFASTELDMRAAYGLRKPGLSTLVTYKFRRKVGPATLSGWKLRICRRAREVEAFHAHRRGFTAHRYHPIKPGTLTLKGIKA